MSKERRQVTIEEMRREIRSDRFRLPSGEIVDEEGRANWVHHLQKSEKKRQWYVYFVQNTANQFIKIGVTTNVKRRLVVMQIDNVEKLKLLGKIKGDITVEAELHRRFKEHQKRGEWFHPSPEVLAFIAENKMGRKKKNAGRACCHAKKDSREVWSKP